MEEFFGHLVILRFFSWISFGFGFVHVHVGIREHQSGFRIFGRSLEACFEVVFLRGFHMLLGGSIHRHVASSFESCSRCEGFAEAVMTQSKHLGFLTETMFSCFVEKLRSL